MARKRRFLSRQVWKGCRYEQRNSEPSLASRVDRVHLFELCVVDGLCCSATAADEPVDFGKQIAPIFEQHCVRCHSPGNNKGDVSLATFDDLKSNEYVVAGDPDGSYLIELVTSQDGEPPAMPKEAKPLSDAKWTCCGNGFDKGQSGPMALSSKRSRRRMHRGGRINR